MTSALPADVLDWGVGVIRGLKVPPASPGHTARSDPPAAPLPCARCVRLRCGALPAAACRLRVGRHAWASP